MYLICISSTFYAYLKMYNTNHYTEFVYNDLLNQDYEVFVLNFETDVLIKKQIKIWIYTYNYNILLTKLLILEQN